MLKVFEALVDGKIAYEIYDGKNKLATIYNWDELIALWGYFRRLNSSIPEVINLVALQDRCFSIRPLCIKSFIFGRAVLIAPFS